MILRTHLPFSSIRIYRFIRISLFLVAAFVQVLPPCGSTFGLKNGKCAFDFRIPVVALNLHYGFGVAFGVQLAYIVFTLGLLHVLSNDLFVKVMYSLCSEDNKRSQFSMGLAASSHRLDACCARRRSGADPPGELDEVDKVA